MTQVFRSKLAVGLALGAVIPALLLGCAERGSRRHLTKVQAYLCSQPRQATCTDLPRGEPIPRDTLPPVDQAFQLWAWHPGTGAVQYRAEWKSRFFSDTTAPVAPKQAGTDFKNAGDSTMLSYNFAMAARTRYVVRVLLLSPKGTIEDQDSLVWDYSNFPADPVSGEHMHHH